MPFHVRLSPFVTAALGITLVSLATAAHNNWPCYRGPTGLGEYAGEMATQWCDDDVTWRTDLGGRGHSSPCIWGERIYITAAIKTDDNEVERSVIAVDRNDGKIAWRQVASVGGAESVHGMNSFATSTCATDGKHVVAYFGRGGLHCFDTEGKSLWSLDLGEFPGPWGTAASPIILGEVVIQNCDAAGKSSLIAFHLDSGKVAWKTERADKPRGGWNTPILINAGERNELIVNGEFGVKGYDPATGRELWFCRGFIGRGTPIPAVGNGLLVVLNGKPGDVYAVQPGGEGDVTETRMEWHTPRRGGRDCGSPIMVENRVIVANMTGICTCYQATTGKELWQARLGGNFTGSPVICQGLVYIQNEAGETIVIKPDDKLNVVARNEIEVAEGELFRSSLAPSDGQIFMRSTTTLYCVGKRNPQ